LTPGSSLCTRCGVCSAVCPTAIVGAADEDTLPGVPEEKAGICVACGHCEAFCPSQALTLNVRPEEKVDVPAGAGTLPPGDLGVYLQKRRSVRRYTDEPVPRETILAVLDVVRYAPSGGNGQPVRWIVVHDPEKVRKVAELTIEWMKGLVESTHPMSGYVPGLIRAWEAGNDVICRGAPHLLVAHIPEGNPVASVDAIIAMTHFDVAAPAPHPTSRSRRNSASPQVGSSPTRCSLATRNTHPRASPAATRCRWRGGKERA